MRVLFVSDSEMAAADPPVRAGTTPGADPGDGGPLPGDPRRLLTGPPHFGRGAPDAHADTDLVEALEAVGIQIHRADWAELARGAVDLELIDLVHLRPGVLRRGPRSGDRRAPGPAATGRGGAGRFGALRRHPSVAPADRPQDRRTAAGLLARVPPGVPIVLTLPARPPGPLAAGSPSAAAGQVPGARPPVPVHAALPLEVAAGRAGSRAVHVIAADLGAAEGLQAVLPGTHAASVAVIGRGFGDPSRARAFDVNRPVVLAITAPGSSREAVGVLRAAEALGRAGRRFYLVLAGVGPTVRGVSRRVALAEAAGVDVRLLGRASRDELARWRATATVCVLTSGEPEAERDLAELLLAGVPVIAALDPVHADVAAQSSVLPDWFARGDTAALATRLKQRLASAARAVPSAPGAQPAPAERDAVERGPVQPAPAQPGPAQPGPAQAGPAQTVDTEHGGSVAVLAAPGARVATRALPTWQDIAGQTTWVYQKAVRAPRG